MRLCGLVTNLYSRLGMQADPTKSQVIREWPSPWTVKEVKSLLQTLQYNAGYMAAEEGEKTSGELTAPLRYLIRISDKAAGEALVDCIGAR